MESYEIRKMFHTSIGIMLYLLYLIIGNAEMYSTLLFFLSIGIMIEYSLGLHKRIELIHNLFESLKKKNEFLGEGLLFMMASFIIGAIILTPQLFFAMFWLISISDSMATIFGKKYGKHKLYKNKTLEGSLAFLVSALPLLFFYGFEIIYFIGIAVVVELIEELEDNISISISMAILARLLK